MRDSAWLSQALNQALRAVIARKRLRYLRHREWLQRERAANDAIADYTRLIENHNLRMEFIREAQDVITP